MTRKIYHECGSRRALLADVQMPELGCANAVLLETVNDSGELSMTITGNNPEYALISSMVSEIVVEDGGIETWRGRVTTQNVDTSALKMLTIKGTLDYLHDTLLVPQHLSGSANSVFTEIIRQHNARPVEARKRFTVGTCDIAESIEDYEVNAPRKTWEIISSLTQQYGGYIVVERNDTENIIHWLKSFSHHNSQTVEFGKNLIALSRAKSIDNLATVIYAYGARVEGAYVNISSVNNGSNYISDSDAVSAYGWIEDAVNYSEIYHAAELKAAAQKELAARIAEVKSITITAVDLADLGFEAEHIRIGDWVRVLSVPHGLDEELQVSSISRDLLNPASSQITLGAALDTITNLAGRQRNAD